MIFGSYAVIDPLHIIKKCIDQYMTIRNRDAQTENWLYRQDVPDNGDPFWVHKHHIFDNDEFEAVYTLHNVGNTEVYVDLSLRESLHFPYMEIVTKSENVLSIQTIERTGTRLFWWWTITKRACSFRVPYPIGWRSSWANYHCSHVRRYNHNDNGNVY